MKARTEIHLVSGSVVRTRTPLDEMAFKFSESRAPLIVVEALDGHGRPNRAFVPVSAIVMMKDLGGAPAGTVAAA